MSEDFEKGLQVFREVYGDEAADGCRKGADSGNDFTALHIKFSMELPFGQVWTREASGCAAAANQSSTACCWFRSK